MANLNKVLLMGRLTADPELRRTPNDIPVTTFSVAVNRRFSRDQAQQQVDFIDVVCWRANAEFVTKYFKKGSAIFVAGSLQIRNWKDKEGNNRKTAEVVADEVQFAESKRDGSGQGAAGAPSPSFSSGSTGDFQEVSSDEELPF